MLPTCWCSCHIWLGDSLYRTVLPWYISLMLVRLQTLDNSHLHDSRMRYLRFPYKRVHWSTLTHCGGCTGRADFVPCQMHDNHHHPYWFMAPATIGWIATTCRMCTLLTAESPQEQSKVDTHIVHLSLGLKLCVSCAQWVEGNEHWVSCKYCIAFSCLLNRIQPLPEIHLLSLRYSSNLANEPRKESVNLVGPPCGVYLDSFPPPFPVCSNCDLGSCYYGMWYYVSSVRSGTFWSALLMLVRESWLL